MESVSWQNHVGHIELLLQFYSFKVIQDFIEWKKYDPDSILLWTWMFNMAQIIVIS